MEWEISKSERHFSWPIFGIVSLACLLSATYFAFAQNYFGLILFLVIPVVLFLVATQDSHTYYCRIDEEGVQVDKDRYEHKRIAYFSFVDDFLVIKPKKKDPVYMPIYAEDEKDLRGMLLQFLKEKEHQESVSDLMNRLLKIH